MLDRGQTPTSARTGLDSTPPLVRRLPRRAILAESLERTTHLVIRGSIAIAGLCRPSKQVHRTSESPASNVAAPTAVRTLACCSCSRLCVAAPPRRRRRVAPLNRRAAQGPATTCNRSKGQARSRSPAGSRRGAPTAVQPGRPIPARAARSPDRGSLVARRVPILSALARKLPARGDDTEHEPRLGARVDGKGLFHLIHRLGGIRLVLFNASARRYCASAWRGSSFSARRKPFIGRVDVSVRIAPVQA